MCFKGFVKKIKFLISREFFFKTRKIFFFFVLKCKQKELVHNLKKKMGAKRPKSLVFIYMGCPSWGFFQISSLITSHAYILHFSE